MYNKNNYSKRVYIFRYPFLEQPENREEAKKEQKTKESLLLFVVLIRTRFNSQFIFTWHTKKLIFASITRIVVLRKHPFLFLFSEEKRESWLVTGETH